MPARPICPLLAAHQPGSAARPADHLESLDNGSPFPLLVPTWPHSALLPTLLAPPSFPDCFGDPALYGPVRSICSGQLGISGGAYLLGGAVCESSGSGPDVSH